MKYKVHRLNIRMTTGEEKLEEFLNSLDGEVIAIIPNVSIGALAFPQVDFLLIAEKLPDGPAR